jgi:hypothetical protein
MTEIMPNVINSEWDITLNGNDVESNKHKNGI